MRKPLSILILALFIIPLMPLIAVPHVVNATTSGPTQLDTGDTARMGWVAIGTSRIFYVWTQYNNKDAYYKIFDNNLNQVASGQVQDADKDSYYDYVATNGSYFAVLENYQKSGIYDVNLTIYKDDGTFVKEVAITNNPSISTGRGYVINVGDYWVVSYYNTSSDNITIVVLRESDLGEQGRITNKTGQYGYPAVMAYSPTSNKVIAVFRYYNGAKYDMKAVVFDPDNPDTYKCVDITTGASADQGVGGDVYKLKRGPDVAWASTTDLFLAAWADENNEVWFAIIDPNGNIVAGPTNVGTAADGYIYPRVASNGTHWAVLWRSNEELMVTFVDQNGNSWTGDSGEKCDTDNALVATIVYNGGDFTVVYGDQEGNVKAFRTTMEGTSVKFGSAATLVSGVGVNYLYAVADSSGRTYVIYKDGSYYPYALAFDRTDVPTPTLVESSLEVTGIVQGDVDGDGYLEAGEWVAVKGTLKDQGGAGISGKTVEAQLRRFYAYHTGTSEYKVVVATETNTTGADGSFTVNITIPSGTLSGVYNIYVKFAGDASYTQSHDESDKFLVYNTAPSIPTWESEAALSTGPAYYVKNGQIIIYDPDDDVREREDLATEKQDMDVRQVNIGFDNNYIYIRVVYDGNAGIDGDAAPAFLIVFDFTPNDLTDGIEATTESGLPCIPLFFPAHKYTDAKLWNATKWDLAVTLTPVHSNQKVTDSNHHVTPLSPLIWVANATQSDKNVEMQAGYLSISGGEVVAAIPLDTVRAELGNKLPTTGALAARIFTAVFALNTSNGYVIGLDGPDWFDIPGAREENFTGTALNQGYTEHTGDSELDTKFIINFNLDSGRFFAYTQTYITATNMTLEGLGETRFDGPRSFVGEVEYIARLRDANNTLYYVYGKELKLYINGTEVSTQTTDEVGVAAMSYTWGSSEFKHNQTLKVSFAGDSDYVASESTEYTAKTMYVINITELEVTFDDNNGNGLVDKGETIHLTATVKMWDGSNWVNADGVGVKFYIGSSPVYLGTATASSGIATLDYTPTGSEGLIGTGHTAYAGGDGETSWAVVYPGAPKYLLFGFNLAPVPELPVLPIVVLAAVMLLLLVKRRR